MIACDAVGTALRSVVLAVLAVAMSACAKEKPKLVDSNVFPADYKVQIADLIHRQMASGKVRNAYIAEPALKTFLPTPRFVACVRYGAVDRSGAVKGDKLVAAYFYAGKINQVVDATVEQCDKADFQPFPELQTQ
jgi:hypothetical protein